MGWDYQPDYNGGEGPMWLTILLGVVWTVAIAAMMVNCGG